jgi:predicted transcriptional regulator of viral defense system
MNKATPNPVFNRAVQAFKQHRGLLRTSEAMKLGIHTRTLYQMRDKGIIVPLSRGLYRLKTLAPLSNPDFAQVAIKAPKAVICLVSALSFHSLTTQVPHEVYLALRKGDEPPRLDNPPVRIFWFSKISHHSGIETHETDGIEFRIYSAEKTVVDCFQYRNKIGLDTTIEALRLYRETKKLRINDITRFARICRVENVMRPYLEALL